MSTTAADPPVSQSHSRRWQFACATVFLLLAVTCILKHVTFHASVYDLGIFHQVLWNTSRLRWFESSLKHMSYLGDHFSPGLALLSPLEWLPLPVAMLLMAQAAAVVATAYCVRTMAMETLHNRRTADLLGVCTLIHPALYAPAAWDFHPEIFMAAALAAALLAIERRRWLTAALWVAVFLSGKEDAGMVTLGLGVVLALQPRGERRRRLFGVMIALASMAWVVISIVVLMPRFRPVVEHGDWFYLGRFAHLGSTPGEIARFVLLHPLSALWRSATAIKVATAVVLVLAYAGMPLRGGMRLLAVVPAALEHFLSARQSQFDFWFHYLAPLVPLVGWAAIAGAPPIMQRWPKLATGMGLTVGLVAGVALRLWPGWFLPLPQHAGLRAAVAAVPEGAAVCAQNRTGAWLTARREFDLCVMWETERAQYQHYGWPIFSSAPYQLFDTSDDDGAPGHRTRAQALLAAGATVLSDRDGVLLLQVDEAVLRRAGQ